MKSPGSRMPFASGGPRGPYPSSPMTLGAPPDQRSIEQRNAHRGGDSEEGPTHVDAPVSGVMGRRAAPAARVRA